MNRRDFLLGVACGLSPACASRPERERSVSGSKAPPSTLQEIEDDVGGRVGVSALDTGSGRRWAHRSDERFAMCSTFKWILAALVLERIDRGELSSQKLVPYDDSDLLEYAPFTREHVAEGALSVERLAEVSVTLSDNTAANLLLQEIGGPAELTRFVRALGDPVTRLDRNEPRLNSNEPKSSKDTTSPRAMVDLMDRVLCGHVLLPSSQRLLLEWLRACQTGKNRLRAGLPSNWNVGTKTGSGPRGAVNDLAIATPPDRAPLLIATYMSGSQAPFEQLEATHARVARFVVQQF